MVLSVMSLSTASTTTTLVLTPSEPPWKNAQSLNTSSELDIRGEGQATNTNTLHNYDLTYMYFGCDNHVSWSAILRFCLMNNINCPKVRRFGLYVSMVTDGGIHTWRATIPSHAVHYHSAIFERIVIKLVKPASVTTANDNPANHNVILMSVE